MYRLKAIVRTGWTQYEKDYEPYPARGEQWMFSSYRKFFPCDINGSTENLPEKDYADWADRILIW